MALGLTTHVIIVGGGASGVLLACHLLKDGAPDIRVTLIEKRSQVGSGIAYGTANSKHLLNVRASNMSAFQDDPDHFLRWLASSGIAEQLPSPDRFCFVPRPVYGHYVGSLLEPLISEDNSPGRLHIIQGECVSIAHDGSGVKAALADGAIHEGDIVVLATGNEFCTSDISAMRAVAPGESLNPPEDDTVLMIGTGLTMIDHVLTLVHNGHKGRIVAMSRRGLLPQAHRPTDPVTVGRADIPFGRGVSQLTRWLRARARADRDWRAMIDGLRPHIQEIWQRLPLIEKQRFLRHARPWWDVHRHRMAPEVEQKIKELIADGQLTIVAGKVTAVEEEKPGKKVRFRRRNQTKIETLRVQRIIECRGLDNSLATSNNPVLRDLLQQGLVRPDDLNIGVQVTQDCAVVDNSGKASSSMYAVGPITRSNFWEIVAVPDIRVQCAGLARRILEKAA